MEKVSVNNQKFTYEISDETIKITATGESILFQENFVPGTYINLDLLTLILEDKKIFDYAIAVFTGAIKNFKITISESIYEYTKMLSKKKIYEALREAIRYQLIDLNDETRARFHLLKEMMYIDFYEQCHQDDKFDILVDGLSYNIKVQDFFNLLRKEPLELASILKNEEQLYGIKKEHFLYALVAYFGRNFLTSSYEFTPNLKKNYDSIYNETYADIKAINKKINKKPFLDKVNLDDEFEKFIISGIKPEFTDLEKSIYIYLKLCKVLTYDEEFYAARETGNPALKHKEIERLKNISLKNNSVVCWEFSIIFEYFLNKLGIIAGTPLSNYEYGSGHTNTEFRCGKFYVLADALTSIFSGDLYAVKVNKPVTGLICMNNNPDTQKEFKRTLDKMYDYVKNEELFEYQDVLKEYSIDDLLVQYRKYTKNYKEVPFPERVAVLFEKVKEAKRLKGMDVYSYIRKLGGLLFNESERKENIKFIIIKNNEPDIQDKEVMPLGVITINQSGFAEIHYENSYYIYSPHTGFEPISYFTLEERFKNGTYQYLDESSQIHIPGITTKKEKIK